MYGRNSSSSKLDWEKVVVFLPPSTRLRSSIAKEMCSIYSLLLHDLKVLGLGKDRNNSVIMMPKFEKSQVARSKRICDRSTKGRT